MSLRARAIRQSFLTAGLVVMFYPALSTAQAPAYSPPNQPQQEYPPSNVPQQAYPPGYYPQSPRYTPAPMVAEPSEPAYRRGFLAMPYIGIHIPTGDFGDAYDSGLRLGTLLGGHISPTFSLNGEFTIDILNPSKVPSGMDVTAVAVDMLFSPLFHFGSETFEGFVGPKLGAFGLSVSTDYRGESFKGTAQGLAYGFNAGFGIPVGTMAVGGLFSYVGRHATRVCTKESGSSQRCDDSPEGDDAHTLAFTGMILF